MSIARGEYYLLYLRGNATIMLLSENMYEKQLTQAGLTQKQAALYMAALELGHAKATDIARKAGVKRTTGYGILDELAQLGLVSVVAKGKLKFFKAQAPRTLVGLLDQRKRAVEQILPDLENVYGTYHLRPKMQFFEGREGIKRIYEDTLTCRSKKILQIIRVKDFKEFPGGDFSEEYIKRRAEKGIVSYALHPSSGDIHDNLYAEESDKWKRHVRYLPAFIFQTAAIMIYDHKVAVISTKAENFGFIIESKEFSNTLRAYFEFMWKLGTKTLE